MPDLIIDFETRSRCNLLTEGTDNYVTDPSTDILCLAVIDMESAREWLIYPATEEMPRELADMFRKADLVVAHNARFDQGIWECVGVLYDFPILDPSTWYCSAAHCRVNALPSSLDDAARACLGGKHRKDHRGAALIRKLSIPDKKTGEFNEDPQLMQEMGEYCLQDVRLVHKILQKTRPMTQREHLDWQVSERINDRGVKIDVKLAKAACSYAEKESEELGLELSDITDGAITKTTQSQRVKNWLVEHLENIPLALEHLVKYVKGEKKYTADKNAIASLLDATDSQDIDIPDNVYYLASVMQEGGKSSVAKFTRMVQMAETFDHRVRGAFLHAGAGQTHRFSSRGLQVHNFARACFNNEEAEAIRDVMLAGGELEDCMATLSKMLRPALIPEDGNAFVVGDWSAIEARVLPWLANTPQAENVLDVFRSGGDIYMHTAEKMKIGDRQIGKVATLALGFGGSVGAFSAMAKAYGLILPEAQKKNIVDGWRRANPWAVRFWKQLEDAAKTAIKKPHVEIPVGHVRYVYIPELMSGTLMCILPNDSVIQYPFAKMELVETPYGKQRQVTYLKASVKPSADSNEWPRRALWGGLMAENATQAVAGALLRDKLLDLRDEEVVLHVHDEIVLEVELELTSDKEQRLQAVMETVPDWAKGLPLSAEPKTMLRYGK